MPTATTTHHVSHLNVSIMSLSPRQSRPAQYDSETYHHFMVSSKLWACAHCYGWWTTSLL